ncbi:MAG: hypothetical protein R6V06_10740 [Kiritimatiellia bacterium]
MAAPIIWIIGVLSLLFVYFISTPEWIELHFDQKGGSPVEIATVALFFFQMFFLWVMPPVPLENLKGKALCFVFSVITFIAICREMDWHKKMIDVSHIEGATHGTPFKMRFLTNPVNPLADRLLVLFCFIVVIGLCAGILLWYIRPLVKGLFRFQPVCWSIAFIGGTGILIKIFDRISSILRKDFNIMLTDQQEALTCALEEGQEVLLPLFVIIAIMQAHFIFNNQDGDEFSNFRNS